MAAMFFGFHGNQIGKNWFWSIFINLDTSTDLHTKNLDEKFNINENNFFSGRLPLIDIHAFEMENPVTSSNFDVISLLYFRYFSPAHLLLYDIKWGLRRLSNSLLDVLRKSPEARKSYISSSIGHSDTVRVCWVFR